MSTGWFIYDSPFKKELDITFTVFKKKFKLYSKFRIRVIKLEPSKFKYIYHISFETIFFIQKKEEACYHGQEATWKIILRF